VFRYFLSYFKSLKPFHSYILNDTNVLITMLNSELFETSFTSLIEYDCKQIYEIPESRYLVTDGANRQSNL
jgi:hypothetical protein